MLNSDQERQRAAQHIKSFDESAVIRTQGASDISDGTSSVGGASKSQLHKTSQVPQVHTAGPSGVSCVLGELGASGVPLYQVNQVHLPSH